MLKERIESELKTALKSGDQLRLSVLRMVSAALHNREIEKRSRTSAPSPVELTEDETIAVIRSELKKRREAAEAYAGAGRHDAAGQEASEAKLLEAFLPQELSDAELAGIIEQGRAELGVAVEREFGKLMGWVMAEVRGRASGDRVRALIEERRP